MKGLDIKLKRFIKNRRFNYDSEKRYNDANRWIRRGKIKGEYRITWIKVDNGHNELSNFSRWSDIVANVTVKGKAEQKEWCPSKKKTITVMGEISGIAKYERQGATWTDGSRGCWYDQNTNSAWGWEGHKKIREQIRVDITNEVNDFLKLIGIKNSNKIRIGKITWEK